VSLPEKLVKTAPRDKSGSRTSDRFRYQRNWALCRILSIHKTTDDYLITFDYHEDVSICDSASQPTKIRAYQIKTKDSGGWTANALVKQEKGENGPLPSILGKLYTLRVQFGEEVDHIAFVSNQQLSTKLEGTKKKPPLDKSVTKFEELDKESRSSIETALATELGGKVVKLSGLFQFELSDLPLKGHDTHARGKLSEFLHELYPDAEFSIVPIYNSLLSEIELRNNNSETTGCFEDYVQKKSLSRDRFSELLVIAGAAPKKPKWDPIQHRLDTELFPVGVVKNLHKAWDEFRLDRMLKRDVSFTRFDKAVQESVKKHIDIPRIDDLLNAVSSDVGSLAASLNLDPPYVKAAALFHLYES